MSIVISIIILIAELVVLARAFAVRKEYRAKLELLVQRDEHVTKREAACREAMRKNGRASLELSRKESDFDINHKEIEAVYLETTEDRVKYPSDAKRLAVIKSRLAHNLGYKILAEFPDPEVDPAGTVYSYKFLVKEEK